MWIWIVLGVFFCALFLKDRLEHREVRSLFFKGATSLCFFVMGWQGLFSCQALSWGLWLLLGLFFGLFGDIWLGLKWAYPKQDTRYTFAGFICFALEHFCILMGLVLHSSQPVFMLVALVFSMIGSYVVVSMEKRMKLRYGLFKGVALVYGIFLLAVPLYSFFLCLSNHMDTGYALLAVAGLNFVGSDIILSGTYFGKGKDVPLYVLSNHIFYYLAQFLIALVIRLV